MASHILISPEPQPRPRSRLSDNRKSAVKYAVGFPFSGSHCALLFYLFLVVFFFLFVVILFFFFEAHASHAFGHGSYVCHAHRGIQPPPAMKRSSRFHFAFKSNSMNSIAIPLCIRKFVALKAPALNIRRLRCQVPTLHNKVRPLGF